jgi:hypothetical protein
MPSLVLVGVEEGQRSCLLPFLGVQGVQAVQEVLREQQN